MIDAKNLKLTTVKVFKDKYDEFKVLNVTTGISLQKLVNRSLYLYVKDMDFRNKIDGTLDLQVSGSSF